jgi:uncharacterized protein (TIGR02145 family)
MRGPFQISIFGRNFLLGRIAAFVNIQSSKMKRATYLSKGAFLMLFIFLISFFYSCKKEDCRPDVSTNEVTGITQSMAICGGVVTSEGCAKVIARGVCWSGDHPPTTADAKTEDGASDGSFTSNIIGLVPSTTYFIRAYATNRHGTAYGPTMTVTTSYGGELVTDIDGNIYHTITIGTQVWMLENLRVTRFRNGDSIKYVTDSYCWDSDNVPHYCPYNSDESNVNVYGYLYNQSAVLDTDGLAPSGWHVPSPAEIQVLIDYLGGEAVAGGKLKEYGTSHWHSPNIGASNESGFTALPGGRRVAYGAYERIGDICNFWSSYPWWLIQVSFDEPKSFFYIQAGSTGASVRCIRD